MSKSIGSAGATTSKPTKDVQQQQQQATTTTTITTTTTNLQELHTESFRGEAL
jgi:hypothetical protein